jgi:ABC-type transport system involved in multi-copper enzyme maturation permease subunit
MSAAAVARIRKSITEAPWRLWGSQLTALLRIEIGKNLWMRRSIWIYLLAFIPTLAFAAVAMVTREHAPNEQAVSNLFAVVFQTYYLRFGIFFGCMGLFTWLFRGEVVEKTLHYYFLSPVRRELLILGKFIAGVVSTTVIFGAAVFGAFVLAHAYFGPKGMAFVFSGPGREHLIAYLLVTFLASLGFGSVFLALSLVFKNPILPGIAVLLWETFHAVAPSLLQKLSVSFYLKQLCPVVIPPEGLMALFTIVAEPVSPWLAIPGLVCLSVAILIFACMRIQRTEISYLAD